VTIDEVPRLSSEPTLPRSRFAYRASPGAVWSALLAVYIIWGSTYLAIRFAIETLPVFLFAAARFLIAGAALYLFRRSRGDPAPTGVQWRAAALVGILLLSGGNGTVVWAEQTVPSGLTALILATVPLWMALLDWLRPGGRRPQTQALLGILIGFGGVAFLIGGSGLQGAGAIDPVGAGVLVFGAFLWASGSLYSRHAPLPRSGLLGTGMEMLAGGAGFLILAVLHGDLAHVNAAAFSLKSLLAVLYLIVVGAWVAYSCYVWLLRVAPTPLVSTFSYVNPVVAIFLGYVFASEPISLRTGVAAAIILLAVVITSTAPAPKS